MKKQNLPINLGIVSSLLFCMAFACNDGDKQGRTDGDETPPRRDTLTDRKTDGNSPQLGTQAGVGASYGARDPFTCADSSQPSKGAPSPEQAADYVTCGREGELANQLYLSEDVTVKQISKGRAYNPINDRNISNVDVDFPVYPIRGSYQSYQCDHIYQDCSNAGKNCRVDANPNADGVCYKDTFGDWHCGMNDVSTSKTTNQEAALPRLR